MNKLKFLVITGLLAATALCAGLVVSSWTSQTTVAQTPATTTLDLAASASAPDAVAAIQPAVAPALENMLALGFDNTEFANFDINTLANELSAQFGVPNIIGMAAGKGFGGLGDGPEAQGTITAVENGGAKLTLNNRRVVNLNDQTVTGDANGTINRSDLKVGDRISAVGKVETDKSLTARWVLRLPPLPTVLNGVVSAVDANANTLKIKVGRDNAEWTVNVSASTTISKTGAAIKLGDLTAGDGVIVVGTADQTAKTIAATSIVSGRPQMGGRGNPISRDNFANGAVKSIDAANNRFVISYTVGTTVTERTITVDANTKYVGNGLTKLADLKVGDGVTAYGDKQADNSLKATTVARTPVIPGRPGGGGRDGGRPGFPGGGGQKPAQPTATPTSGGQNG
jgi:hypothetical protein